MNMGKTAASIIITAMVVMTVFTGAAAAKSLYLIANHHTAEFDAWDIGDGCNATYQFNVSLQHASWPADIAVDESSKVLFITSETGTTVEMVDATTMNLLGEIDINPPGQSNAGIEADDANDIVYLMQRGSAKLYAFDWDPNGPSLTLIAGFPKTLVGGGYGIALDETAGILWVADGANQSARAYDTSTWLENVSLSFAPSHKPIDIAVDRQRGFVYTVSTNYGFSGPGGSTNLSKYDLATSTETTVDLECEGVGVAVDEDTGCVYVTVAPGCSQLKVFTSDLQPTDENDLTGSPAGICIPQEDIGYTPLNITKTDDAEGCVDTRTFSYTICYDNQQNMVAVHNVTITDTLPGDVRFLSAPDGGIYDASTHTVTWDIGTVQAGATSCVTMRVLVEAGVAGGTILENCATIKSDETEPRGVCIDTVVCEPYPTPIYSSGYKSVPALTSLGMILLIGVLLVVGSVTLRRKR